MRHIYPTNASATCPFCKSDVARDHNFICHKCQRLDFMFAALSGIYVKLAQALPEGENHRLFAKHYTVDKTLSTRDDFDRSLPIEEQCPKRSCSDNHLVITGVRYNINCRKNQTVRRQPRMVAIFTCENAQLILNLIDGGIRIGRLIFDLVDPHALTKTANLAINNLQWIGWKTIDEYKIDWRASKSWKPHID